MCLTHIITAVHCVDTGLVHWFPVSFLFLHLPPPPVPSPLLQVYNYAEKTARVVFGPDLVILNSHETFNILFLSGVVQNSNKSLDDTVLYIWPSTLCVLWLSSCSGEVLNTVCVCVQSKNIACLSRWILLLEPIPHVASCPYTIHICGLYAGHVSTIALVPGLPCIVESL